MLLLLLWHNIGGPCSRSNTRAQTFGHLVDDRTAADKKKSKFA
jgi:hypothetical protein